MNINLFQKIKSEYKNVKVITGKGGICFIKGFLYKGINVEISPYNSADFVIRFGEFEFFDNNALEKYFRRKLIYQDVKFHVNSLRIYAYVNHKQNDNFRYEVFEYTIAEIKKIISDMHKLLND